jgi:putative oxidoreductase
MNGGGDLGKLLLRITVAGLMIGHGIHKIQNGIGGIESMLDGKGLPTFLAYGVYVGEVLAPLLLIVGLKTRLAALALAINMGMAIYLAHWDDLFKLSERTGAPALELQLFYLLAALSIMLIGPGRMAIDGRKRAA